MVSRNDVPGSATARSEVRTTRKQVSVTGRRSLYTRVVCQAAPLQLDTTEAGGHLGSSAGHPRVRLSLIGPCQHVPPSVLSFTYVPHISALERLYSVASSRGSYGGEKIGWHQLPSLILAVKCSCVPRSSVPGES